jgi:hypothetical protein
MDGGYDGSCGQLARIAIEYAKAEGLHFHAVVKR